MRVMYVDRWHEIYADDAKMIQLGAFCRQQGITALNLYDLHRLIGPKSRPLHDAIQALKARGGITVVNAAYSAAPQIAQIGDYNKTYAGDLTGTVSEIEWWQAGGNWTEASGLIHRAAQLGLEAWVYIGWPKPAEMEWLSRNVDVLAVHAYRQDGESPFEFTRERLTQMAAAQRLRGFVPIFSAEPDFMGPWLRTHALPAAETRYETLYGAWAAPGTKPALLGTCHFCYSHLLSVVPVST